MARNKVQFQKGLSEAQFDELYGTEERCHAELARLRWPHGFECPDCGGHGHCVVKRGARQLFQCNACRKQTSMKAGTIFASSKLPLRLWFRAMYLLTQSKKGISSIELGRGSGLTDNGLDDEAQACSGMLERNGAKRLNGDVQMDDAYLGGARSGKPDAARRVKPLCCRCCDNRRRQTRSDHSSVALSASRKWRLVNSRVRRLLATPTSSPMRLPVFTAVKTAGCTHTQIRTGRGAQTAKSGHSNGSTPCLETSSQLWSEPTGPCSRKRARYLAEFGSGFNRRYRLETMIPRLAYVALRTAPMQYLLLKLADVYA